MQKICINIILNILFINGDNSQYLLENHFNLQQNIHLLIFKQSKNMLQNCEKKDITHIILNIRSYTIQQATTSMKFIAYND